MSFFFYQTVEDAIEAYKSFPKKVFTSTLKSDTAKFDHRILEQQIKKVITKCRLKLHSDVKLKDSRRKPHRTFVVSTGIRTGGSPIRMQ